MDDKIEVKVVKRKNKACLIEYVVEGTTKQIIVPEEVLEYTKDDKALISWEEVEMGMPYGIEWEVFLPNFVIKGEDISKCLQNVGIRTVQDFEGNPGAVLSAVSQSAQPILAKLQAIIKDQRRRQ